MPNSVAKGRSRIALLAVLAVLASLFVLPAAPASAATGDVENPAEWSACVGAAMDDAGFTDVTGSFAADAIDCIAHYGITTGTSATTYSPAQVVTRWQMALFLVRAAGPAGITVPAASDQGFTDIAGLPQATQDAINQLAALGISKGTSATTFAPMDAVSRYQMALFLIRFLDEAGVDFDGASASGFSDTGSVSFEAYNAIEDAYDFGITTGTTATTYSPYAAVTREQMAAFIARTLAHTNARPAGLSFQVSDTAITEGDAIDVQISVRAANFAPVVDSLVDVFTAPLKDKADALKADGTCDLTVVDAQFGGTACTVELAEATATDANGNIDATLTEGVDFTGSTIWWAWTGDAGDTFDVDTTPVAAVEVTVGAAPVAWKVSDNVNKYAAVIDANSTGNLGWEDGGGVKYGTTVTLTFQLIDADGDPVALAGEDLEMGYWYDVDDDYKGDFIIALESDANGTATYSWTFNDPSSTADNATVVQWYWEDTFGLGTDNSGVNGAFAQDYVWEDDAAATTTVVASSANDYVVASDASTGATNTVRGSVYDQYGIGRSGVSVDFSSDDTDGLDTGASRTTNSAGVATLTYARDAATTSMETLTAEVGVLSDTDAVYWVAEEADGATQVATAILVADADNDTLVLQNAALDYVYVVYDSNDQFNFGGATTYSAFDADIDDGDITMIAYDTYRDTSTNVSSFTGS